jgi:hypothetical protein
MYRFVIQLYLVPKNGVQTAYTFEDAQLYYEHMETVPQEIISYILPPPGGTQLLALQ